MQIRSRRPSAAGPRTVGPVAVGPVAVGPVAVGLVAVCLGIGGAVQSLYAQSELEQIQIEVGEFTFDALVAGPTDGPLVFLLHGFPQSSFEWRHQLPVLAAMGFRAVAPDQRGYSPGARPEGVEAYATANMVADVAGMADALDRETFHVVGHDWGAAIAWFTGLTYPDRVESLVPMSVPHPFAFGQALANPEGEQAQMSGYMEFFRSEGAEEAFLANDAATLRGIYGGAGLTTEEADMYVDLLSQPGALTGALNWYRAMDLQGGGSPMTPIAMPTMYIWSTNDVALGREGAEATGNFVEGPYRFEILEGVSHWVPEEAADRVNQLLREHFAPFAP